MSINILVVDDNLFIRHGVRTCIETRTDWKVSGEAENGKVAIEMVRNLKPDLVLLDLAMPLMNGLETAREISKITPNLPMIMFTLLDCNELLPLLLVSNTCSQNRMSLMNTCFQQYVNYSLPRNMDVS